LDGGFKDAHNLPVDGDICIPPAETISGLLKSDADLHGSGRQDQVPTDLGSYEKTLDGGFKDAHNLPVDGDICLPPTKTISGLLKSDADPHGSGWQDQVPTDLESHGEAPDDSHKDAHNLSVDGNICLPPAETNSGLQNVIVINHIQSWVGVAQGLEWVKGGESF
jgi:hypothetical protein